MNDNDNDNKGADLLVKLIVWCAFTFGFCLVTSVITIFFWEIIRISDEIPYEKVFQYSFIGFGTFFGYLIIKKD